MIQTDELIEFAEEEVTPEKRPTGEPWSILIVDDDPDVHRVTKYALDGSIIFGRALQFFHAYSAEEGIELLAGDNVIHIVLLDVIMETPDAGLKMVQVIREELQLLDVRIILRTGQPGQVPEVETITLYDINDYKTKNELTRSRLLTTITVALRSWEQLTTLEKSRTGLEKINRASNRLMLAQGLEEFADGVLSSLAELLNIPRQGIVCIEDESVSAADRISGSCDCRIIGACGRFSGLLGTHTTDLEELTILQDIEDAFSSGETVIREKTITLYFQDPTTNRRFSAWVSREDAVEEPDPWLLSVFSRNLALSSQNIGLVDRLKNLAWRDSLLGMPNLVALNQKLSDMDNECFSEACTLTLIDIDNFGQINDYFGHDYGNLLLHAMRDYLSTKFDSCYFLARIAADVFAILGPDTFFDREIVQRLNEVSLAIKNGNHHVTCCIGYAAINSRSGAMDALKNASIALKRAKSEGLGYTVQYTEDIGLESRNHSRLLQDLRESLTKNQLYLVFQPQFRIKDRSLIGFEALLRWRGPDGVDIPPDVFIPLAEQGGLMISLGMWVLRTALHSLRRLWNSGYTGYRMAVNISATQLRHPDFLSGLDKALEEARIMPSALELEITESVAIIGIEGVVKILEAIRKRGISLAVDDFGTGYSSLSSVDRWPIDRLKIDKSFIQHLEGGDSDARIVDLVIPLAQRLSLTTLAEGVETEAQLELLKNLGCEEVQGYLLARPMEFTRLKKWIAEV